MCKDGRSLRLIGGINGGHEASQPIIQLLDFGTFDWVYSLEQVVEWMMKLPNLRWSDFDRLKLARYSKPNSVFLVGLSFMALYINGSWCFNWFFGGSRCRRLSIWILAAGCFLQRDGLARAIPDSDSGSGYVLLKILASISSHFGLRFLVLYVESYWFAFRYQKILPSKLIRDNELMWTNGPHLRPAAFSNLFAHRCHEYYSHCHIWFSRQVWRSIRVARHMFGWW